MQLSDTVPDHKMSLRRIPTRSDRIDGRFWALQVLCGDFLGIVWPLVYTGICLTMTFGGLTRFRTQILTCGNFKYDKLGKSGAFWPIWAQKVHPKTWWNAGEGCMGSLYMSTCDMWRVGTLREHWRDTTWGKVGKSQNSGWPWGGTQKRTQIPDTFRPIKWVRVDGLPWFWSLCDRDVKISKTRGRQPPRTTFKASKRPKTLKVQKRGPPMKRIWNENPNRFP